eukprot:snap_masked-scaffold_6-processed-gene-17.13-mRNA-1 protein AED:1.00 eAED:1.00 QI:0/-1/0/0/-1/1/1/0/206
MSVLFSFPLNGSFGEKETQQRVSNFLHFRRYNTKKYCAWKDRVLKIGKAIDTRNLCEPKTSSQTIGGALRTENQLPAKETMNWVYLYHKRKIKDDHRQRFRRELRQDLSLMKQKQLREETLAGEYAKLVKKFAGKTVARKLLRSRDGLEKNLAEEFAASSIQIIYLRKRQQKLDKLERILFGQYARIFFSSFIGMASKTLLNKEEK